MDKNRRRFLLGSGAVAGAVATIGYSDTLKSVLTAQDRGTLAKDPIYGNAAAVEASVKGGNITFSPNFTMPPSVCTGCTTFCSLRVKIDKQSGNIERIFGNPYSPLSSDPWIGFKTPIKDSFKKLSAWKDEGVVNNSTACARGNAVFEKLSNNLRVTTPLKRVGERGSDKWVSISPEQLIKEIVEGGNLFGEGHVDGLKAFAANKNPIDPQNPEYGAMSNKLCIIGTADDGRNPFIVNRFVKPFKTVNFMGHTAICGLSMRSGEAAYLDDFEKYPHLKPDFENCRFLLSIATAPAQAGNPFKRQANLLAEARSDKELRYVTVTPNLTNSDSIASGDRSRWVPIKPGSDLALVMGIIRVIIEEKRYNEAYLSVASETAKKAKNEASYSNAAHLVIADDKDADFGKIVADEQGAKFVIDKQDGKLKKADEALEADILFNGVISYKGKQVKVKTAFALLSESAFEHPLDFYASECDVDKSVIVDLAREFTSHGRAVAVDCHGGTMHTTGFYTTYAIMMLGALVGNLNYKGGMSVGGGKFKAFTDAPVYDLFALGELPKPEPKNDKQKQPKPIKVRIDRARVAYEDTTEYKRKIESGQNPYPAKDAWYPFTNALESEAINNSANGYPYKLGALISWCANFVYGQSGSSHIIPLLKDPKKAVPLFVAIDPFINETSRYADYIVPDSALFESWGVVSPWSGYTTKASHLRFPVLKSPNALFKNGEPVSMDSFIIELGKALKLKGFGQDAIVGMDGQKYPLDKPEDFYLRAFENVAMGGKEPVLEASDEEIKAAGIGEYVGALQKICKENYRRVAYIMCRGGRFAPKDSGYDGDKLTAAYNKPIAIYNQKVALSKNSFTGERYSGVPRYYSPRFYNGKKLDYTKEGFDMLAFSYKSNVLSSATASVNLIRELTYTTFVDINSKTAKAKGLKAGDIVKVISPDAYIIGMCRVREGIYPGSIGIEHGGNREAEGGVDVTIAVIKKCSLVCSFL